MARLQAGKHRGVIGMASDPDAILDLEHSAEQDGLEMPRPTIAPLMLSLSLAMLAVGLATSPAFMVVGAGILIAGLGLWISQLLPGRGHIREPLTAPARRPGLVAGRPSSVEHLHSGMPGYRLRLPAEVHSISAGVWGGVVGGLVMPIPAMVHGLVSGHGIWFPVNLLAGMVLPAIGRMTVADLEQFHPGLLLLGIVIHAVLSVVLGLTYGVLLPTLPPLPKPIAWGGLLMPLLWTGASFSLMGAVNPVLSRGVDWPWFIASQLLFGVVAAVVVMQFRSLHAIPSGLMGGIAGGLVMPVPALLWGLLSGVGIWYPVNLLAGMVLPGLGAQPAGELEWFHASWLALAIVIHAALSMGFGLVYGVLLPRLRPIPGPMVWGGLLFPLLWTGTSHGLMGVVNPLLQRLVDWPWFVASQFVFGVVAAIVVVRSEKVQIAPAGRGPDRVADIKLESGENRS
ncbi:MAG: hypothetical protein ACHRXM_04895 [Isosphaerales bacterium]